ncbi:DUF115 domain-containing protein [Leptospira sp. 96542]|nr:DUF115 domain-containing protein [Leptospira sp. 96542]
MDLTILKKNLDSLPNSWDMYKSKIESESLSVELTKAKSGDFTLEVDGVWIHSRHDPKKEAERFARELPDDGSKRIYMLFGAGIGHILPFLLEKENTTIIWLEPNIFLLKFALSIFDFSEHLKSEKLSIIRNNSIEDDLLEALRGKGTYPISFVPHRGSLQWKESEYLDLRNIAEQMFHKKDVNLATLTRFEKIWAKNICFNFPELQSMLPVSKLFGLAEGLKIVVAGAGPSLSETTMDLKKYRDQFLLLAVDTAVPILHSFGVDPDLIYSVDPQVLNSQYLEDYNGEGVLVFDPTSTYVSLRLEYGPKNSFVTSSPFPLIKILERTGKQKLGDVPFGGSVSTNAASLANLMGASVYLVGQDLSFTNGLAHSKGAVLEERLNYLETRKFRREKHNYKQLFALPPKKVNGVNGEVYTTNEKMMIFKKWFEDHVSENNWTNLTKFGAKLEGMPHSNFEEVFTEDQSQSIKNLKLQIKKFFNNTDYEFDAITLKLELQNTISNLNQFLTLVKKGNKISARIYSQIKTNQVDPKFFAEDLRQMDFIDGEVSSKKGLNEILSLGIQRIILTITEGYDEKLTEEEKSNERLQIAKKSVLLYEGLLDSILSTKRMLTKSLYRLEDKLSSNT